MDRDILQEQIAEEFCALPKRKALAVLGTSFGKSKVAFLIIKKLKPERILFLVESTTNRDITIKEEYIKWGMEKYSEVTEFATYQLAYKWKKQNKNLDNYLIIADECDFAFTNNYGKFFLEYRDVDTFAMTGYITQEKYTLFKSLLPLLVSIPVDELQTEKILNETIFKFIQFPLNLDKNRPMTYKKNGEDVTFYQSENDHYKYFIKKESETINKMMAAISRNDTPKVEECEKILQEYLPRERAAFLYDLDSSISVTKILIGKILNADSKNKIITFSERTKQADAISENSYHGKTPKVEGDKLFGDFQTGAIRVLSTCAKVNRGVNIPGLNYAIMESFTSEITAMMQKNGRLCRLGVNEVGTIYFLLPYYWENKETLRPTRAVHWARKIMEKFPGTKLEVLNYCGNAKILKD